MIKFHRKNITKWAIVLCVSVVLYIGGFYLYHFALAISSSPEMVTQIEENHRKLSSKVLIRKLHSVDPFFDPYYVLKVLAERKEKEAVPDIIKLLKSPRTYYRQEAIRALGQINDPRAIKPLMDVINKGENHPDYEWALLSLSKMKHEGAFSYVIEIAKKPYPKNCGAIGLLEEFGNSESITLLQDIKKTIKAGTPNAKFYKSSIAAAIKHIESLQKAKESGSQLRQ